MRPWRLTRRQRVEMEAALAALRADVFPRTGCHTRGTYRAARIFCDAYSVERWDIASDDRTPGAWRLIPLREWRILRARVALALRAALRADDDARCEEALGMASADGGESYGEGVVDGVWAMREWPFLSWRGHLPDGTAAPLFVPRALWEVAR